MKPWILLAIISAVFAGVTSVIAKLGLIGISGELGLTVRTLFVSAFVFAFAAVRVPLADFAALTSLNYLWLGLSGLTTSLS